MANHKYKLTPKQLKEGIEDFLEICKKDNRIPLVASLCLFLKINDDTLSEYRKNPKYAAIVKRYDLEYEQAVLRKGLEENKPVMPIFLLKAKFNYRETANLDITSNGQALGVVQLPPKNPNK